MPSGRGSVRTTPGENSRLDPPGWRPSFGHWRPSSGHPDASVRSPPTRSAMTVGHPDRSPRRKTAEQAHRVTTTFSTSAKARGHRGGRPSPAALLLKAVQNEGEGESNSSPEGNTAGVLARDPPDTEQLEFIPEILEMAAGMCDSAESSDVVLHSEAGLALHAHRAVLAGWSRVLRSELSRSNRRALDLPYEGIPDVLDSMLRCFYTGYVDLDVSEDGTATALLAISLAYDVRALTTRLTALLDASRGREHWWGELQDRLGEVRGEGSMDDMWQRAQHLEHKPPDAVDRRTTEYIQSGRIRINLEREVVRVTAAMFHGSMGPAATGETFSDATLSVPVDDMASQEFSVHRGVVGYWSGALQRKLLQQREDGLHGVSHRGHSACKVNLEFRLRSQPKKQQDRSTSEPLEEPVAGGERETIVIEQLLRLFYTGLLQISSTENANELLQAAVAFEVPTVERAARTWLLARYPDVQPTVSNVHSVPPQLKPGTSTTSLKAHEDEDAWNGPAQLHQFPNNLNASPMQSTTAVGTTVNSHLEDVYRRLDPSGHGLSLHEVETAIREIAPDLFASPEVDQGHEQDILLQADGSTAHGIDHGIDFHKAAEGIWIISGIKPGTIAASTHELKTGMQILKINNKKIDVDVQSNMAATDHLHHELTRKLASGDAVKLTTKARKSSMRDWSVEERRKALHWAYKAADEHGDGWISVSEFVLFHAFLRYVYDNFMEFQRVLDQVGFKLTFTKFQRACSMIPHTRGDEQDFKELCHLPTAVAADVANAQDFITWAIRTNAGEKQTRLATQHEFIFDQPAASGITFARKVDEKRCVETVAIKSIQQGSEAEAQPGLRVGMILTSISSPALSTKQTRSERFLDWLSGDDIDAVAQMADGAPRRIKQSYDLERARLREVCKKTNLLNKGSHIGWDGLCDLGFKAVDNLLKQLFSTDGSRPIVLGFQAGQPNLLFPGRKRCDDTFDVLSHNKSFVSLRAVEEALPGLFSRRAEDVPHKTLISAYRAADMRGDGCLSKGEFRKCMQFLVYFHNNAHEFQAIEEASEDRRYTLEDFKKHSLSMGEHLTDDEALAEFTTCNEEEMLTTDSLQNEHARESYSTISYEIFCTWLARRASLRMLSEAATPHRIHEVSHSGLAARAVHLSMPSKDRIRTAFDVRGGIIAFNQLRQKLHQDIVVKAATELFPEAHKRRLARVAGYAHRAAFVQIEQEADTGRPVIPEEVIALCQQILKYMIVIDDVWDKVNQEVQHRHRAGSPKGKQACCAASHRPKPVISAVMSETNFIHACNVAGYHVAPQQAAQEFRNLCQGNSFIELDKFCVWIAPKIQDLPEMHKQTKVDSSKFWEHSGGRNFISASQVRQLTGRSDKMLDVALAICQSEHDTVWEHEFNQVMQVLEFLDDHCAGVARLLAHDGDGSAHLNLVNFRRCCDLIGYHMSEVEVSRQFGQFDMGPEGYVDVKDFYEWFVRQEIAKSLTSRRAEIPRLPLLVLPPRSRVMSVAQGLADPVNRCLTWDEVHRATAELLPEFQHREEILTVAFQLKIDRFAAGELVQAEDYGDLMIYVSRLFRWWAKLQNVHFPIPRKRFFSACLLVDPDISREESAMHFDRFQGSPDSDNRQMSRQDFCAWLLKHTDACSSGEQAATQAIDINAAFDRYSQDGAVEHKNIGKLISDLHPNLHPHFAILAQKAAKVNGKARLNRDSCERLDRCIRHFVEIRDDLSSLYASTLDDGQGLFQNVEDTETGIMTAVKMDMDRRLYKNYKDVPSFNRFWEDKSPAEGKNRETDGRGEYVTFSNFCCWSARQQLNVLQLQPRNNTQKFDTSFYHMSVKSLYKLGMQYMRGEHPVPKNPESAVACFRVAADQRHTASQRVLGECLMAGDGVSKDPTQAAHYYQLAAEKGDTIAQAHLGVCYLTGDGVDRNLDEAVRLFRQAGEDPVAQFNLGVCYANGQGVSEDAQTAVEYYEKSADKGLVEAQCNLGECLMKGYGIPKNLGRAVEQFMLAAKRGLPAAQYNLGLCYSRGEGVNQDDAAALHYYQLAADRNHARAGAALQRMKQQVEAKEAMAQFDKGKMLLHQWDQMKFSDAQAQAEHLAECIRCFDSAVKLNDHHDAMYELAKLHRAGAGHLTQSDDEAYRLAKPAADAYHSHAAFLCAQLRLIHWHNMPSARDVFDEALFYCTVAAESDNRDAQFVLGYILLCQACKIDDQLHGLAASMQHEYSSYDDRDSSGGRVHSYFAGGTTGQHGRERSTRYNFGHEGSIGDGDDIHSFESVATFEESGLHELNWADMSVVDLGSLEKSKHWFAKATEGDNVHAMRMLGELYLHGCGVVQSDLEALDWFQLAAEHNDVVSLCKQAWLMIKGTACRQDFDEAKRLFEGALKIDRACLEARIACKHFEVIRECARRSSGDYAKLLKDLVGRAPDIHIFARSVASDDMQANPLHDLQRHRSLLEEKIEKDEIERNRLSARKSELREEKEHLDAHLTREKTPLPRHVLLISRRLPAVQLLLESVCKSVAIIECDEVDELIDIVDQIRTTVEDAKHTLSATSDDTEFGNRDDFRLDSIAWIDMDGELCDLGLGLRSACKDFPVNRFDESTWSRHSAMFSDRADEYFDAARHRLWCQAADRHVRLEEEKILKAKGRVTTAQDDARRAEQKLQDDQDKRQRELRIRHDQRKRRQEEHGISRPWGEQHDPALADFLDDDTTDNGAPSLFGYPLSTCSRQRQMSSQDGLHRLPRAIEICAEYVRNQLGTTNVDDDLADLFKMPHNHDVVEKLTAKLDCFDLPTSKLEELELNVLDVAWVIVSWLQQLPQPLLSTPLPGGDSDEMYRCIQQVGLHDHDTNSEGSTARAISDLKQLLDKLPADHYAILAFVMQLLHDAETEYARRKAGNARIDAKRASLIMTPALICKPPGSARETVRLNHRVVAVMIEHFDLVFREQKLNPGTYSIEGHVSSIDARGTLLLTDTHQVEGYLAVYPCIEPRDERHSGAWMVRHILNGGTWGMDGKMTFSARGPLRSEFRIAIIRAQRLEQLESVVKEIAVRVVCDFGTRSHPLSDVTQNKRIRWEEDLLNGEGTRVTGCSEWESGAGECLSFVSRTPPLSFRLRCLGEGSSGTEELMGEAVVELEERPSSAPAWVQELDVDIRKHGQSAGSVRVVIQWDPARTYDYTFIADDEQIRGKCSEKMLNGHPVETQATRGDDVAEFTLSRALAQETREGIQPKGLWYYARIMPVSTVTDRRTTGMVLKEKQQRGCRRIVVHRLEDHEDGSKGPAEKAGVRLGDELLEVNGETVHSASRANAIIMQCVKGSGGTSGPGNLIELLFTREEQPLEKVTPRASDEVSADTEGCESHNAAGSRRRRRPGGGCCGARPTPD